MESVLQENNKLTSIFDDIESLNSDLKTKNRELIKSNEKLEEEIEEQLSIMEQLNEKNQQI